MSVRSANEQREKGRREGPQTGGLVLREAADGQEGKDNDKGGLHGETQNKAMARKKKKRKKEKRAAIFGERKR